MGKRNKSKNTNSYLIKNRNKQTVIIEENQNQNQKKISKFLQPEEKKQNNFLAFITAIFVMIIAVLSGFGIYKIYMDFNKQNAPKTEKVPRNSELIKMEKQKIGSKIFNKKQNILILGVDSNGPDLDPFEGTRSDSIVILSVNPKKKSVNILSIPRDSKVFLAHDKGVNKINAAHAIGGIQLTKDTIEETFGFKINNYIIFNTEGIVEFIDAIGGVPVYVEKDMKYHDYSGKLHIDLKKGTHVLSGKDSEGFLRYRKDMLGDIGRTSRQQWFLRALAKRLKDPEVLSKIPSALKVADKYVKSDLSLYQMSQYAALATSIDMSKVETATLPGNPNKRGSISYWILEPEMCQDVINRMIYNTKPDINIEKTPVAGILYNNSNIDEAKKMKQDLEDAGYTVNISLYKNLPHPQIFGHSQIVTKEFISRIKKTIPEIEDFQFVYDPLRIYCANSDFTIILSK